MGLKLESVCVSTREPAFCAIYSKMVEGVELDYMLPWKHLSPTISMDFNLSTREVFLMSLVATGRNTPALWPGTEQPSSTF